MSWNRSQHNDKGSSFNGLFVRHIHCEDQLVVQTTTCTKSLCHYSSLLICFNTSFVLFFLFCCRGADRLSPVRHFFTCVSFELIPALLPSCDELTYNSNMSPSTCLIMVQTGNNNNDKK